MMMDTGLMVAPGRWPHAFTLDGEEALLHEATQGSWVAIIHALPDWGWIVPPNPTRHAHDFARFFPEIAADCLIGCVALTGHKAVVTTNAGPIEATCIVLSGDEESVAEMLARWAPYLWERSPIFARRDPSTVMHVPLTLPFDQPDLALFPHVRFMPAGFDVDGFASVARAPFATFKGEVCRTMIAFQDLADDAVVALFGLRQT